MRVSLYYKFIQMLAGSLFLVLTSAFSSLSQAAEYPDKPVTLVVPYGAGGSGDVTARLFSEQLSKVIGQPVVIENRPGIIVGTSYIARSAPDGFRFLAAPLAHSVNPALYKSLPYDSINDFAPVATLGYFNFILVVNSKLQVTDLKSFITLIKSSQKELSYGSGGTGTTSHIGVEWLNAITNTKSLHVPYRSDGAAITDLIGGRLDFMLCSTPSCIPHIKSGAIRALALTSAKRFEGFPEIPTTTEAGLPEFKVMAYYVLLAPKNTPSSMVAKIADSTALALKSPTVQARLLDLGFEAGGASTPISTAMLIANETARWTPIIRAAGVTVD